MLMTFRFLNTHSCPPHLTKAPVAQPLDGTQGLRDVCVICEGQLNLKNIYLVGVFERVLSSPDLHQTPYVAETPDPPDSITQVLESQEGTIPYFFQMSCSFSPSVVLVSLLQ